ncbi:MAG TPA: ABC transporter permease [Chloroflexota bacterium]|nr:ABC transporter permease [Chloroflexota bacterium]
MIKYLVSRLLWLPVVLWAVASLTFLALRLVPGTPIDFVASQNLTTAQIALYKAEWGLNQPLWLQYLSFLSDLVRGHLGNSMSSAVPVKTLLIDRIPPTMELAISAMIISTIVGLGAGIISSTTNSKLVDYSARIFSILGLSVPWFWMAIVLIIIFAVKLGWLPVGGQLDPGTDYKTITHFMLLDAILTGNWSLLGITLRHLALPALAIGLTSAGFVARLTRSAMLEVLRADYVRTARAKGLIERKVVINHALRNAILPVLTLQGLQFGSLLGGAVITELVFSWPGMGRLLLDGVTQRDYPVVQAAVIFIAFIYVLANLFVDLLYHLVDPRLRAG